MIKLFDKRQDEAVRFYFFKFFGGKQYQIPSLPAMDYIVRPHIKITNGVYGVKKLFRVLFIC